MTAMLLYERVVRGCIYGSYCLLVRGAHRCYTLPVLYSTVRSHANLAPELQWWCLCTVPSSVSSSSTSCPTHFLPHPPPTHFLPHPPAHPLPALLFTGNSTGEPVIEERQIRINPLPHKRDAVNNMDWEPTENELDEQEDEEEEEEEEEPVDIGGCGGVYGSGCHVCILHLKCVIA